MADTLGAIKSCGYQRALVVALADDYGEPDAGTSFEAETFVDPLARLFSRVDVYPVDRMLRQFGYFGMAQHLRDLVRSSTPDLLFCVPFENQIDWDVVKDLRNTSTTTLAWMCDDHWRYEDFTSHIAASFDAVATTDRSAYAKYLARDVEVRLTQWGYNQEVIRPRPQGIPAEHDVSFVGQARPHRERLVDYLERNGVSVYVRGRGWPLGRASTEEVSRIPAYSKISLNFADSSVPHARGSTQLKARPFELAGAGTCIVTEDDPQLAAFFRAGLEIAPFRRPPDGLRLIKELLADAPRREALRGAAHGRALAEHTYEVRLSRLIESLGFRARSDRTQGEICVIS